VVDHVVGGDHGEFSCFEVVELTVPVEDLDRGQLPTRGVVGVPVDAEAAVRVADDVVDLVSLGAELECRIRLPSDRPAESRQVSTRTGSPTALSPRKGEEVAVLRN